MDIVVVGSFMMDLVVQTSRAPKPGETIIGNTFNRFPGGKGANQVVSASRLGAQTMFVGNVGSDLFGQEAIEMLKKENVNIDEVLIDTENATGVGMIVLDSDGENRIVVVPGSNLTYTLEDLKKVKKFIKNAKVVVLQLEMDLKVVEKTIEYADEYQTPIILNPAPAIKLNKKLLSKVTYLTPNESEAELLTGIKINDIEDAIKAGKSLLGTGIQNIIITLGKKGALIVNKDMTTHIPGYDTDVVDTVAAGDSFNGALAVGITKKWNIKKTVDYANAVGALTTTQRGAIPSLPYKDQVDMMINKNRETVEVP